MNREQAKKLVGVSDFDTAKNVYFLLSISKELKCKPYELIDSIYQLKGMTVERKPAKLLFEALIDCSSPEEQVTLIKLIFDHFDGDIIIALTMALNDIEDGLYKV